MIGRIFTIVGKELRQLTRDRMTLFWALAFPTMFGILFGSLYGGNDGGMPPAKIAVVDEDCTKESVGFIGRLKKNKSLVVETAKLPEAQESVRKGKRTAYMVIPKGWGDSAESFFTESKPLTIGVDPKQKVISGMIEGLVKQAAFEGMSETMNDPSKMKESISAGLASVKKDPTVSPAEKDRTARFLTEVLRYSETQKPGESAGAMEMQGPEVQVTEVGSKSGIEPASSYEITFPQAILWGLMSVVNQFAISMVKERQTGTMARLRLSPLPFGGIIAGKALACFFACSFVMALFMTLGAVAFGVRVPSPPLAALAIAASALCFVGLMNLLSVMSKTEQAASGSVWGVMMVIALFGGGMMPAFMMPGWMQRISDFSPAKWAMYSMEGAIWRGFDFAQMMVPVGVLLGIGAASFALSIRVMSKMSA